MIDGRSGAEPSGTGVERAHGAMELGGYGIAGLLVLLPGGGGVIGQPTDEPLVLFLSALVFTLPLSLGIAIWAIGLARVADLRTGWAPLVWTGGVAFAAFVLADVLGGSAISVEAPTSSLPAGILEFVLNVLTGFARAYGPVAFFGAFAVGAAIAWIYLEVIDPRKA